MGTHDPQGHDTVVLCVSGKSYTAPSEIAWDRRLDPDKQIRALEKWLRLTTDRYHETEDMAHLEQIRDIKYVLNFLRTAEAGGSGNAFPD